MISKNVYSAFDTLRWPMAVLVVFEHLTTDMGTIINGERFLPMKLDRFAYPIVFLNGFLSEPLAVPMFLFISGYLFFRGGGHFSKEDYVRKIKNRLKTLVLPYFVWSVLAILFLIVRSKFTEHYTLNLNAHNILSSMWIYRGELVNDPNAPVIAAGEWNGPFLGPLWYIRNLFLLCLFSPVIFWLLKSLKKISVCIVACLWLASMLWIPNEFLQKIFESLCFFTWGGYVAFAGENDLKIFDNRKKQLLIVGVCMSLLFFVLFWTIRDITQWIKLINSFVMIPALIGVAYHYASKGIISNRTILVESSLFVYLAHMFMGPYIVKIALSLLPVNNWTVFAIYIIAIVITLVILDIVFHFLRRTPSWIQVPLFGKIFVYKL